MAGIGFRIQKLIDNPKTFSSFMRGYLYSSMIAAGPMLVIVSTIALTNYFTNQFLPFGQPKFVLGLIVYSYGFSILGSAPFLFVVMRYLSDKFFEKHALTITPTYITSLEVILSIQAVIGFLFLTQLPELSLGLRWLLFIQYLAITGIWVSLVFLSLARDYKSVFMALFAGIAIAIPTMFFLGKTYGLSGFIKGFALGQITTFIILNYRIIVEFGLDISHDYGFYLYFRRYPYLCLIGIAYYVGLWVDRFVFWSSNEGESIRPFLRISTLYDVPMFYAFLTIVPAMGLFLIQLETSFFKSIRGYFSSIRNREPLSFIRKRHDILIDNLTTNLEIYVIIQGIITGFVLLFAVQIGGVLLLTPQQLGIFRIGVFGAFIQFGFIIIFNLLFYFECQREIFLLTLLYLFTNSIFTAITLYIGLPAYGFGYAAANFVTLFSAILVLNSKVKNLHYNVFMKTPITTPKFEFESERVRRQLPDPSDITDRQAF